MTMKPEAKHTFPNLSETSTIIKKKEEWPNITPNWQNKWRTVKPHDLHPGATPPSIHIFINSNDKYFLDYNFLYNWKIQFKDCIYYVQRDNIWLISKYLNILI